MTDDERHLSEPDFAPESIPAEDGEPAPTTDESRAKAGGDGSEQPAADPQSDQGDWNDAPGGSSS